MRGGYSSLACYASFRSRTPAVLMKKLLIATGPKSEDSKAPFKAIRNAVMKHHIQG